MQLLSKPADWQNGWRRRVILMRVWEGITASKFLLHLHTRRHGQNETIAGGGQKKRQTNKKPPRHEEAAAEEPLVGRFRHHLLQASQVFYICIYNSASCSLVRFHNSIIHTSASAAKLPSLFFFFIIVVTARSKRCHAQEGKLKFHLYFSGCQKTPCSTVVSRSQSRRRECQH